MPFVDFIVWQTKWLNEFMRHQPGKFITIIEVEREVKESVFHILQESGQNVFLNPTKEIIENYLYSAKSPIIIQNLITEAPTQKIDKLMTATLEKILVDIISDSDLFSTFQGRELHNIYQTAFERYKISQSKMKRYAKRRSKMEKLNSILSRTKIRQQVNINAKT